MQPGYGLPQHGPASARAVWSMVLAVAGWMLCGCLTSLPAVILAKSELSAIERGESSGSGKSLATGAFWIGLINLALYVVAIGIVAVMAMIGARH